MRGKKWFILLPSLVIILLASSIGVTRGSFIDLGSSTGNTFQAWASTQWVQTTQADFQAGVLSNVDTSSSPGDVKLASSSNWYNTSWAYRKQITFTSDSAKIPSTQSYFPVLIELSDSDLAADAQDDGDDILFTSSDGTTQLDHEIEEFDGSTGELVAWVEVPSLSTGTMLHMYYGNATCGSQQNPTGVWDSNFKGVWHLKETTGGTDAIRDSTSNDNDGTDYPRWKYRRPITLSPATPEADYQVKVELTTSNFDYSKAETNGQDIRFYDTSGNSLNYWIEKWDVGGTSTIWVKVATSGTSIIYIYYGNPSANSESDRDATFVFFETFPNADPAWNGSADTAQDEAGWVTIQDTTTPDTNDVQVSDEDQGDPSPSAGTHLTFEDCDVGWGLPIAQDLAYVPIDLSGYTGVTINYYWQSDDVDLGEGMRVHYSTDSTNGVDGTWNLIAEYVNPTDNTWYKETYNLPQSACVTNFKLRFSSKSSSGFEHMYVDDVHIRKYASPEPSSTVGSEEITGPTLGITGKIDNAIGFDGVDDYVQTTSSESKTSTHFTWECWFKADTTTGAHHLLWEGEGSQNGWGCGASGCHEAQINVGAYDTDNIVGGFYGTNEDAAEPNVIRIDTAFSDTTNWHHVAFVVTNAGSSPSGELFLDGVSQGTDTGDQTGRANWDTNFRIGRPGADQRYFDGTLDEVRISDIARSADWIKTCYNNQNSPSTFYSVEGEESFYVSPGTIASQVLDTGVAGATWDALFWDETLQSNTDITFEVRASDTSFAKGDASPTWTAVGGISPVTSGLPSGRYMQWRATLTTSDTSKTPTLHEVRVYHY